MRAWTLASRPAGLPNDSNFAMVETPDAPLGADEFRITNSWLSVDPYMRGRMNDAKSYSDPFALGEPMTGGAVGVVTESNNADFPVGAKVLHMAGWRDSAVFGGGKTPPAGMPPVKLPDLGVPDQHWLSIIGMPGGTAASQAQGDVWFYSTLQVRAGGLLSVMGANEVRFVGGIDLNGALGLLFQDTYRVGFERRRRHRRGHRRGLAQHRARCALDRRQQPEAGRLHRLARSKAYLYAGVEIRWKCASSLASEDVPSEAAFQFPGGLADHLAEQIDPARRARHGVGHYRVGNEDVVCVRRQIDDQSLVQSKLDGAACARTGIGDPEQSFLRSFRRWKRRSVFGERGRHATDCHGEGNAGGQGNSKFVRQAGHDASPLTAWNWRSRRSI